MEDKNISVKMMHELTKTAFLTCTMKTIYLPNIYSNHNYISGTVESLYTQWRDAVTLGMFVLVV